MQVDLFVDLLAKRYGLEPREVVDAVRWVQAHKEYVARMKHGGMLSLVGIVITAAALAIWEGAKAFVRGDR